MITSQLIRTFCFDHFTVENQINTRNEWYGDSKAEDLQILPYSKHALLKEAMFIVAIAFKVLQSGAGVAWRKKLRHKIINHRVVFLSQSFRCVSSRSQRSKQHLKVCAAQIGLHNCNTFKEQKFNKLQ